jgi:hypothetical protein
MCRSMADDDFFIVDREDVPVDPWIMVSLLNLCHRCSTRIDAASASNLDVDQVSEGNVSRIIIIIIIINMQ